MQSQPPIEEDVQDTALDIAPPNIPPVVSGPVPETTLPDVPPVTTVPIPAQVTDLPAAPALATVAPPLAQPGNTWLVATNLVPRDDGRLKQSDQSPEINKYISKMVRLGNLKVFFVDAFPNPEKQNNWLAQSLVTVLQDQAKTDRVAHEVNLRAQQDNRYMSALISMVRCSANPPSVGPISELDQATGRWCNARQLIINGARALIKTQECTFGIAVEGLEQAAVAAKVEKLLDEEAFHFRKASSVSVFSNADQVNFLAINQRLGCPEQGSSIPGP